MIKLNRKYRLILCVSAMMAMAFTGPVDAAQIRGTVTDGDGLPIENVWITAFDAAGDWITNAGTGSDGVYDLGPVDPGSYYLQAEAGWDNPCLAVVCYDGQVGYFHFYSDSGRQGELASIEVSSEDVFGIDFMLSEIGGMVQGRLTASDGITPIENAGAVLHSEDGPWVAGAGTDSNGDYVMYGVTVGTYVMEAWGPEGSFFAPGTYHLPESLPGPLWYEDNMANATRLSVHPCATTNNIDVQLPAGGAICGTVTTEMGVPVNGVEVDAFSANGQGLGWVYTEPDGSYFLGALLPGDYYVTVWPGEDHPTLETVTYNGHPDGFWDYWEEGRLDELDSVIVASDQCTGGVDFALPVGGAITGRVTEADDVTPIPNARVELFDEDGNGISGARTENDGSYMFHGVAPGSYIAHARRPEDACYQSRTYDDLPGKIWGYDNLVNAMRINVWSGAITSAIDFHLPFGNTISGTVTEEGSATPIIDAAVEAYDPDQDWGKQRFSSDEGVYELCVRGGGYIIDAWGPGGSYFTQETYEDLPGNRHTRDNWDNATWIVVGEGEDVPSIDFSLSLGGRITGVVQQADRAPVDAIIVQAYDSDGWHILGTGSGDNGEAGGYSLVLEPGSYYVNAFDAGWNQETCLLGPVSYDGHSGRFETYACNDRTAELNTVDVLVEQDTTDIDFTLPEGGAISGRVTESDGVAPLPDAQVVVYDEGGCWIADAWTEGDGSYTVCGLAPGRYIADATTPEDRCYRGRTYDNLPGTIWTGNNLADAARIDVLADTVTPDIDFQLPQGGIISGTVTEEGSGVPMHGTQLTVFKTDGQDLGYTETLDDGTYSLCVRRGAGEYLVEACPPPEAAYVCEVYDGLPGPIWCGDNLADATRVPAAPGIATPDIDFSLEPVPVGLGWPNGGEVLTAGSTYDITWNAPPDAVGDLGIFLLKGYEPQCPETGGLVNIVPYVNGTYSWTPSPFLAGDDFAIKLCLMAGLQNCDICDKSNEWFSIIGGTPPAPTITVTAPQAEETWFWGREVCVEWEVDYPDLPALEGMEVTVVVTPALAPVAMFVEMARITDGQLCLEAPCHLPRDQDYVTVVMMPDDLCVLDLSDPFSIMPEPADFDVDCDVDLRDVAYFQRCFAGEGSGPSGACQDADLDDEGDVDLFDYRILFGSLSAPRDPGSETHSRSGEEDARIRRALEVLFAPTGERHDPSQVESRRVDGVSRPGS